MGRTTSGSVFLSFAHFFVQSFVLQIFILQLPWPLKTQHENTDLASDVFELIGLKRETEIMHGMRVRWEYSQLAVHVTK